MVSGYPSKLGRRRSPRVVGTCTARRRPSTFSDKMSARYQPTTEEAMA